MFTKEEIKFMKFAISSLKCSYETALQLNNELEYIDSMTKQKIEKSKYSLKLIDKLNIKLTYLKDLKE